LPAPLATLAPSCMALNVWDTLADQVRSKLPCPVTRNAGPRSATPERYESWLELGSTRRLVL